MKTLAMWISTVVAAAFLAVMGTSPVAYAGDTLRLMSEHFGINIALPSSRWTDAGSEEVIKGGKTYYSVKTKDRLETAIITAVFFRESREFTSVEEWANKKLRKKLLKKYFSGEMPRVVTEKREVVQLSPTATLTVINLQLVGMGEYFNAALIYGDFGVTEMSPAKVDGKPLHTWMWMFVGNGKPARPIEESLKQIIAAIQMTRSVPSG